MAADELGELDAVQSAPVLVQQLNVEASPDVRIAILNALSRANTAAARTALAGRVTDPDAHVAAVAEVRFAELHTVDARHELQARAARQKTRAKGAESVELLGTESKIVEAFTASGFPPELRQPPSPIALLDNATDVRFAILGDFGTGDPEQMNVAAALREAHAKRPFQFGITVGDNFYDTGLCDLDNDRWKTEWEQPYGIMAIPFYATLGNHDWDGIDIKQNYCAALTEIQYSDHSNTWRMPRTHYTVTAGPVQLFALDTDEKRAELHTQFTDWLANGLRTSTKPWKIVYSHFPIRSGGHHGDSAWLAELKAVLESQQVDLYIAGHDHDLQHLKEGELHHLIVGGGGKDLYNAKCTPQTLYEAKSYGFGAIHATVERLDIELISDSGTVLHTCSLNKTTDATGHVTRTDDCVRVCN